MRKQLPGRPDGNNPLIYLGSVPNMSFSPRRPTVKDYEGFELGYWWIIPKTNDGSTPTEEIWILVGKQQNIATWKQLHGGSGPASTIVIGNQYITTPGAGTYTPTAGMKQVCVEVIGAGGGGSSFGGGAGGGYAKKLYTAAQIGASQPYFVGTGGAASGITTGGTGQDTTFGTGSTLITGGGGPGGTDNSATPNNYNGGAGTGGDINISGGNSVGTMLANPSELTDPCRFGGGTIYAAPVYSLGVSAGGSANGYNGNFPGGGGSPGSFGGSGGTGANGVIILTEYFV